MTDVYSTKHPLASEPETNNTLTKAHLAELLFDRIGLNKREAKEFVDKFFDELRNALISGEEIKITGFGNFNLRNKAQRPGRNPKTGEEVEVSARKVVTFHPSQKLKEKIQIKRN
ncbi:MAG: integration host factor subunit alpha [Betaproteobacteria bacterium TMED156]|nr:MAG: integration host factor subunit alpha [Betaproteobacteria bacterium TMED156]